MRKITDLCNYRFFIRIDGEDIVQKYDPAIANTCVFVDATPNAKWKMKEREFPRCITGTLRLADDVAVQR